GGPLAHSLVGLLPSLGRAPVDPIGPPRRRVVEPVPGLGADALDVGDLLPGPASDHLALLGELVLELAGAPRLRVVEGVATALSHAHDPPPCMQRRRAPSIERPGIRADSGSSERSPLRRVPALWPTGDPRSSHNPCESDKWRNRPRPPCAGYGRRMD